MLLTLPPVKLPASLITKYRFKYYEIIFLLCHFYNFQLLFQVLNSVLLIVLKEIRYV
jgi:hypothetical protein